jgi:hypothetical protein
MNRQASVLLLSTLLVLLTGLVYWPGLTGDFIFDDYPNIVSNERVHAERLDIDALGKAMRGYEPGAIGRPLATVTIAANWYAGGKSPWGYKFVNLLIHALNAALVFALLLRLFRLPRVAWEDRNGLTLSAFALALLWAVHPIQVSSVLYVIQRMETLETTFLLLALMAYLRGRVLQRDGHRGWPWLAGAVCFACLGLACKENAVLIPLYTLSLECTLLKFEATSRRTVRFLKYGYGLGIAVALVVFVGFVLPRYMAPDAYATRTFDLHERLLSQMRILPMYLGQILLPLPGSMPFYYDAWPKSTGWLQPATTLLGTLGLAALLAAACASVRRRPLFALGIFWFFIAHLLTSSVFNLELVFEHRNYVALLGVLLALADLFRLVPMKDGPGFKRSVAAVVILAFGFLAMLRAATWGEPLNLATELVALSPNSPRASNDLATLYVGMSDSNPNSPFFDFGRREFERGSRLPDASPLPEQGLILMAATVGLPVDDVWWRRLIEKVRTRPISPQESMAVTGLLEQRYRGVELDDRRLAQACLMLMSRQKQPAFRYAQFGDYALRYLHDDALADRMFVTAIEQNPGDADFAAKVYATLRAQGQTRQASLVLRRARELGLMQTTAPTPR